MTVPPTGPVASCAPVQLEALAALHALREARIALDAAPESEAMHSPRRPVVTQDMSRRRMAGVDALLRVEKVDQKAGSVPSSTRALPVRAALVDAAALADRAVVDAAWLVSSSLYRRPFLVYGLAWQVVYRRPWAAACAHLSVALPHTPDATAAEVGQLLGHADRVARLAAGLDPPWTPLPGVGCAGCLRRTLEAQLSPDSEREWIIRCKNGCIGTQLLETYGRAHGRLGDLLALVRSVRRQMQKRERQAA